VKKGGSFTTLCCVIVECGCRLAGKEWESER